MISAEDHDASAMDSAKLRRFAIGTAGIMLIFVAAGGSQITSTLTIETLKIGLSRPGILLWLVPIISVYATVRYWWYGIQVPVTRQKVRKYLRQRRSLLVIKTHKEVYERNLREYSGSSEYLHAQAELVAKVPPGLTPYHFIVFTDSISEPDDMYMLHLCRNKISSYFPGITDMDVAIDELQPMHAWVSPSKLGKYQARSILEDCDLWLPIPLNVVGLLVYVSYVWNY